MDKHIPDSARALARADFSHITARFADAGFAVLDPAHGILRIEVPPQSTARRRLLLSAGIHGDETLPIELLAQLLDELADAPDQLAVDLMLVIGNPDAVARGKRFIDTDLNRLFRLQADTSQSVEARRAQKIMQATADFFDTADANRWHLDLHAAIRPSHVAAFAVVPEAIDAGHKHALLGWLGMAGIGAVILNPNPATTYSAHTARRFGAASATVELGRVGALGSNDLHRFDAARVALASVLRDGEFAGDAPPPIFQVSQELIKRSDAFRFAFDRDTANFTALQPGQLIAEDGDIAYRVGAETEYVVFPNPDVQPGQRAGLMVVRSAAD